MKKILEKIKEYNEIVLYRHVNPDYDAFGSQFGMYGLIKSTFPEKNVYLQGSMDSDLVEKYLVPYDEKQPSFVQDTLAIVLDTANHERIDGDSYSKCKEIIKIDHHIVVDRYGQYNYEEPEKSSCSEMVGAFYQMFQDELVLTQETGEAIYMGIIGDTNRFQYASTSSSTFEIARLLTQKGIDIVSVYNRMYLRNLKDLQINKYIYNHMEVNGHIAYYILKDEDLKTLDISREVGSNYVNMMSGFKEIEVWIALTENTKDHNWRVSLRSRNVVVNEIAQKYNGGGHALASGATLKEFSQFNDLLSDLNNAIDQYLKDI